MVDIFTPPKNVSSESFTFTLKKRFTKPLKYRPIRFVDIQGRSENPTLFLEVLVITSTYILWTTSVVMLIFSGFVMHQHFAISMLTDAYDFLSCMALQMVASLLLAVTASFVCACHNPAYIQVPRLAKWAISFLVVIILILACEICLALYHKWVPNVERTMQWKLKYSINHTDYLEEWDDMHETLSCCGVNSKEDWLSLGKEIPKSCCQEFQGKVCKSWMKHGCLAAYTSVKSKFMSYLTGSASISLANCLIIIPILVRFVIVTTKLTTDSRRVRAFQKNTKRATQPPLTSISYFNRPYGTPEQSSKGLVSILEAEKKELEKKIGKNYVQFAGGTILEEDVLKEGEDDSGAASVTTVLKRGSVDATLSEDEPRDTTKPSTSAI